MEVPFVECFSTMQPWITFGPDHFPYALLAIIVGVVFLVLPLTLVFLYPTGLLHNIPQVLCTSRHVQKLTTFMEVYMGHFKDGTEGNRDYRYFAGGQLLLRLITFIFFFQTQEYTGLSYLTTLILSIVWSLAILLLAPYKRNIYNKFEGIFTFYFCVLFGITFYDLMLELLWLRSYYIEVILYIALFLPSIVAGIGFSALIFQWCCGCSWLRSKFSFPNASTSSNAITSTTSNNMESQPLMDRSVDIIEFRSSDNFYVRDRFADEIGYGTP